MANVGTQCDETPSSGKHGGTLVRTPEEKDLPETPFFNRPFTAEAPTERSQEK
jgi:hypothetical protein